MIPMVDVNRQHQALRAELDAAIKAVLDSGVFILGPQVQAFEIECAQYMGVPHAVACASGTDALHLALAALGIGPGDEVITTPFTFAATAEAILYVGATPRFVDIDPRTYDLDVQAVEAAITPATRAIIPVHLFGEPADMQPLMVLAQKHGLKLVEDCAQSFGARYGEHMTGSLGDAGCYSFFPSKNLGGLGDGGLITCRDAAVAERLRMLRNHGCRVRYYHETLGYNSRLDELQAALLRVKLRHIDHYNTERRRVAHAYSRGLEGVVVTPYEAPGRTHVYHQYTILSDRRDAIMESLKQAGIASAIYYPVPMHKQEAFAPHCGRSMTLPVTEDVAARCLSLPIFPELTDAEVQRICAVIRG